MRKPTICMGENKDADQLRGNREAVLRLCFRYTDSTFRPLLIPKLSRVYVSFVTVQAGLCWTWLKTQIVFFSCTGSFILVTDVRIGNDGLCFRQPIRGRHKAIVFIIAGYYFFCVCFFLIDQS